MIKYLDNDTIIAATTLRNPNMPEANDLALHTNHDTQSILFNRENLCSNIHIPLDHFCFLQQTHSDHIYHATLHDAKKGAFDFTSSIPDCDAVYTTDADLAIGIFTADCVPILLYDPTSHLICAIHSGWVGTTKEITNKTLQHLKDHHLIHPEHCIIFIGPAIQKNSLEVGLEVVEKIQAMSFDTSNYIKYHKPNKARIDNVGLNMQMLLNHGILLDHIHVSNEDTFQNVDHLFSYRRDSKCGRHLSFIMMKK